MAHTTASALAAGDLAGGPAHRFAMTDDPVRAVRTLKGVEGRRTITVPLDKVVIDESAVDEELVAKLVESIAVLDLFNPITVTAQKQEDGERNIAWSLACSAQSCRTGVLSVS